MLDNFISVKILGTKINKVGESYYAANFAYKRFRIINFSDHHFDSIFFFFLSFLSSFAFNSLEINK